MIKKGCIFISVYFITTVTLLLPFLSFLYTFNGLGNPHYPTESLWNFTKNDQQQPQEWLKTVIINGLESGGLIQKLECWNVKIFLYYI